MMRKFVYYVLSIMGWFQVAVGGILLLLAIYGLLSAAMTSAPNPVSSGWGRSNPQPFGSNGFKSIASMAAFFWSMSAVASGVLFLWMAAVIDALDETTRHLRLIRDTLLSRLTADNSAPAGIGSSLAELAAVTTVECDEPELQWVVRGTNETSGAEVDIIVRAPTKVDAGLTARRRGIVVTSISRKQD